MADILCNACNELNDQNAVKCERCKSSLFVDNSSEVDECENDFRFIEEAELKGKVYKLENVNDENVVFEVIPVTTEHSDIKIETGEYINENITEFCQIPNATNHNHRDVLCMESGHMINSITIEPRRISEIAMRTADVTYECKQCSKSFKRKASLKAHTNRVHNTDEDMQLFYPGLKVEKKTKSEYNSKRCDSPAFSESSESDYVPTEDDVEDNNAQKQPKSKLKRGRKLEESDSENNNSRRRTKSTCKTNTSPPQILLDVKQEKSPLKRHMVYKCTACDKITNCYEDHVKHIVIHEAPIDSLTETTSLEKLKKTPSGFLKCDQCDGIFMSDREYARHAKTHVQTRFQCLICKAYLANKSSLRKHNIRIHSRIAPKKEIQFECVTCNQKFPSMILMLHHKKSHMDVIKKMEKMTIIKRDEGKTLYVCKICTRTSNNKYRHEEHLRIHTKEKPYKCEQCGLQIATANALAHHLRLHENDRPFKCDVCSATYRHKKSLKKHLKHHTGEKPFKCRCCERTFVFNYTRADHERKCHLGDAKIPKMRRQRSGKFTFKRNGTGELLTSDDKEMQTEDTIHADNAKLKK